MMKYLLFFVFILSVSLTAQTIRNADLVYDENIQTVLLYQLGNQLSDPVIKINSNDKLMLEFDDLNDQSYVFRYTLIHCDRNWRTSDLEPIEYLDGFPEGTIDNFEFSLNAVPSYIHYKLVFPNSDMKIKLSGNYILKVYVDNDDDENVIFTRRFFVYEPEVRIKADVPYYPKVLEYTQKKQQVDLTVFMSNGLNVQADKRIKVFIRQNGRWDNMVRNLKATSVLPEQLDYNYPNGIVFDGGNQFRNFDMKSFYYQSMYIQRIINDQNGYRVILHTDYSRADKQYEKVTDIHGMKYIKARNDQETDIEGEYAWVDFSLKVPEFEDADVYVIGALNDWQMNEKNRMEYDRRYHRYHLSMFLKQGYYDYLYAVLPHGKTKADVTLIEGDWWDTQNLYKVYVYYTNVMPEYDRLVGYHEFLAHQKQ